jgi:hypothetical protein
MCEGVDVHFSVFSVDYFLLWVAHYAVSVCMVFVAAEEKQELFGKKTLPIDAEPCPKKVHTHFRCKAAQLIRYNVCLGFIYTTHIKFGTVDNFQVSFSISCKAVIYIYEKKLQWLGGVIITALYTARAVCTC